MKITKQRRLGLFNTMMMAHTHTHVECRCVRTFTWDTLIWNPFAHIGALKCGLFVERFTFDKPVITYFSNCGHDECKKNRNSVCVYFLSLFCLRTFLSNLWRRGCRCYSIQIFSLLSHLCYRRLLKIVLLAYSTVANGPRKDWFLIDPSIRPATATQTSDNTHTRMRLLLLKRIRL